MTGYDFHPEARHDLDEIWEFIRIKDLAAADRVIGEVLARVHALTPFPYQGHRRVDLPNRPLRVVRVGDYPIVYASEENPIRVIAALHGHRNPRKMAAILRGRES
ncbi:MAG: type II toxin-antitoxin system RelE/ParE family toxin [Acidobacteria bacterium]|nr:type II toxin-antitoxin system RelE/ParE family toxin [Acidobacteriota bacterium]